MPESTLPAKSTPSYPIIYSTGEASPLPKSPSAEKFKSPSVLKISTPTPGTKRNRLRVNALRGSQVATKKKTRTPPKTWKDAETAGRKDLPKNCARQLHSNNNPQQADSHSNNPNFLNNNLNTPNLSLFPAYFLALCLKWKYRKADSARSTSPVDGSSQKHLETMALCLAGIRESVTNFQPQKELKPLLNCKKKNRFSVNDPNNFRGSPMVTTFVRSFGW